MSFLRKTLTIGSTFTVALCIGFVMQNENAMAARFGEDTPEDYTVSIQTPTLWAPEVATASFELPAFETPEVPMMVPQLAAAVMPDAAVGAAPQVEISCTPSLSAQTGDFALVRLSLNASCYPSTALTIHHQGMIFTATTDAAGQLLVDVPALTDHAIFIAEFANGYGAVAISEVPELAQYDRAVLQWKGEAAVSMHAFEFGAGFGDTGHVWSNSPRSAFAADEGQGFLMKLGDNSAENAHLAEVYTFPANKPGQEGTVELSTEAVITANNCGQDVAAQSIQVNGAALPDAVDLTLRMPDCSAIGDIIVLKNMFQDLQFPIRS